jgi:hypothetical protein
MCDDHCTQTDAWYPSIELTAWQYEAVPYGLQSLPDVHALKQVLAPALFLTHHMT